MSAAADHADDPLSRPLAFPPAALATGLQAKFKSILLILLVLALLPLIVFVHVLLVPPLLFFFASYSLLFNPALLRGLPRDISFVIRLVRATRQLKLRLSRTAGKFTAADYWAETVKAHGPKDALIFEGATWTYAEVDAESDR